MTESTQIYDGEWVDVTDGTVTSCCDCGRVHTQKFVILDGRILRMIHSNSHRTCERRKRKKVKKTTRKLKD